MRWDQDGARDHGTVFLSATVLIAIVIGIVLGPPFFEARSVVRAAEKAGRIDARRWQDALPPRIGAAVFAAEGTPEDRTGTSCCIPFVRTPSGTAIALANRLGEYSRMRTLRSAMTRAFVALMLDSKYEQDQLVDDYARQAYFGRNAFGIEQAAWNWFGKSAAELNVQEAAFLAVLLKGPSNYDPSRWPARAERARQRRDYIRGRMRELGVIDGEELEAAHAAPLGVIDLSAAAHAP